MCYCTYTKKMNMELNKLLVLFRSWCRQTLLTLVANKSVKTTFLIIVKEIMILFLLSTIMKKLSYEVLQFIPNIRICWLYKVLYIFELTSFCAMLYCSALR